MSTAVMKCGFLIGNNDVGASEGPSEIFILEDHMFFSLVKRCFGAFPLSTSFSLSTHVNSYFRGVLLSRFLL